jgi:hypothetical protein
MYQFVDVSTAIVANGNAWDIVITSAHAPSVTVTDPVLSAGFSAATIAQWMASWGCSDFVGSQVSGSWLDSAAGSKYVTTPEIVPHVELVEQAIVDHSQAFSGAASGDYYPPNDTVISFTTVVLVGLMTARSTLANAASVVVAITVAVSGGVEPVPWVISEGPQNIGGYVVVEGNFGRFQMVVPQLSPTTNPAKLTSSAAFCSGVSTQGTYLDPDPYPLSWLSDNYGNDWFCPESLDVYHPGET